MPDRTTLINALRDDAQTYEQTTSAANASHDRDIAKAEEARALAFKIENGDATEEEMARVPAMVHPSVAAKYDLK